MGKVKLYIAQSMDGYIAKSDGSIDWLTSVTSDEAITRYEAFIASIGTIIMGETTYLQVVNELTDTWPYGDIYTYVLSNKDYDDSERIKFVNTDVKTLIEKVKSECDQDIWLIGGANVISQFVNYDLIDEYIIFTIPVVLGDGIKLFNNIEKMQSLKIVGCNSMGNMLENIYIPIREE